MYDLFRFLVLRSAEPASGAPVVDLDVDTPLHAQLREALGGESPLQQVREVASVYGASDGAVRALATLALEPQLDALLAALDDQPGADLGRLGDLVEEVFDRSAQQVMASAEYAADRERVTDTLVAAKLAPTAAAVCPGLADVARALDLLRRVAVADTGLSRPGGLAAARTALLVLPDDVVPPAPEAARAPAVAEAPDADQDELATRALELHQALQTLRAATPPLVRDTDRGAVERRPTDALQSRFEAFVRNDLNPPRTGTAPDAAPPATLTAATLSGLPPQAVRTLEAAADPTAMTLLGSQQVLRDAFASTVGKIDSQRRGRMLPDLHYEPVTEPPVPDEGSDPPPATLATVPATHGTVSPAGIADLLVTRHHTLRYERGEVAHVENVAPGEAMTRETRRLDTSETTTVQTTEVTTEDERDQQTTGRFDLTREAEQVVHSDQARVPGQPSSESYGSLVETGKSRQASTKEAETYGRDVTSRAASRITSRTTSSVTERVLRELEEKATHAFAASADGASLVYQWLDRVVQAQVFSYGKRLMYDIVVPEPADFLARALATQPYESPMPPRPAPFTLDPTYLAEWNWSYYVAGYGATGVTPPPPPKVTVARTFAGQAQNVFSSSAELRSTLLAQGTSVEVPDGYRADSAVVKISWGGWEGADQNLDLVLGRRRMQFDWDSSRTVTTPLDGETGQLPLTARLDGGIYSYTVALEVTCTLTDERLARWQAATHAAVLAAARERLADYEGRLAQLRAGIRLMSAGQTPERKRERERDELHKACLAIISNQQFDGLSAVEHSPQGYPQPYLPNVEVYGRYLRFLENAFEWEQMTWKYSPYFWGRKPYWVQAVLRDDPDPAFADFLRAGAARVLVPVRPGFETAVTDFMQTGTVPSSADLGEVTSALYVPLLQELREPDAALDGGTPYSTPWEVRLPTTLVALRGTATLPRWTQATAADGTTSWSAAAGDPLA